MSAAVVAAAGPPTTAADFRSLFRGNEGRSRRNLGKSTTGSSPFFGGLFFGVTGKRKIFFRGGFEGRERGSLRTKEEASFLGV